MTPNNLDQIRVATPCSVSWESMTGGDRVRFCSLCQLNVYNFGELTQREVEALLRTTEGRICGRLYRRTDGTVITRDCPVGLRAIRRKTARITGAAFATIISLCSLAFGQQKKDSSCRQQVRISSKLDQHSNDPGKITGTILDPVGAVVPGAKITIVDRQTKKSYVFKSDDEGKFSLSLSPGTYTVRIELASFKELKVEVNTRLGETKIVEATLLPAGEYVTIGIIADTPLIDTSSSEIKTVIDAKTIQRLPIH